MLQEAKELQLKAVEALVKVAEVKDRITFKAPTGSGKTFMMALFMERILEHNKDVIFIVSSLSKAKLAKQNYEKFKSYYDSGLLRLLDPYLIQSYDKGKVEGALFIPDTHNVYVLPQLLYKQKNSILKEQQVLLKLLIALKSANKKIYLIKDECHIATNNLDKLNDYFFKIINISATPKISNVDVEISEIDAITSHLIKKVEYKDNNYTADDLYDGGPLYSSLESSLDKLLELRKQYQKFNIKPCMIIQISNEKLAESQLAIIKRLLSTAKFKDLKWISTADNPSLCDTNDQLIKSSPDKWEKYAVRNDSLIDIIIFKMKITEGWDIPRACMLFQIRDSQSDQLDEQVIGRIRRNPLLLNFEKVEAPDDIKLLTTAYVWGVRKQNQDKKSVEVELKGKTPDELANIKNEIQQEFKLKVTKLLDKIETIKIGVNIREELNKAPEPIARKSIFELYEEFEKSSNKVQNECYNYIDENRSEPYKAYFRFVNNLDFIKKKITDKLKDYSNSIEIVKDCHGEALEVSLPFSSMYVKNKDYPRDIEHYIWKNKGQDITFYFDSDAERNWLYKLMHEGYKIKEISLSDTQQVYLIGKNYLPNSDIKYEYYNEDGRHFSYPDFVMKSQKNEYFLFEVKSLNCSAALNIDSEDYTQKVVSLKALYQAVSSKIDDYFCIPIMSGDSWTISCFYKGACYELDEEQLKQVVNGDKSIFEFRK